MNKNKEYGPCYDYCYCGYCWNGWKGIPFYRRIIERIRYTIKGNK